MKISVFVLSFKKDFLNIAYKEFKYYNIINIDYIEESDIIIENF